MTDALPPFACIRDHSSGPAQWRVVGPDGFTTLVGDRALGTMLVALLNGDMETAELSAAFYTTSVAHGWRPAR